MAGDVGLLVDDPLEVENGRLPRTSVLTCLDLARVPGSIGRIEGCGSECQNCRLPARAATSCVPSGLNARDMTSPLCARSRFSSPADDLPSANPMMRTLPSTPDTAMRRPSGL